jgi:DNA-binding GntR family transcriptional regulator
VGSNCFLCKKNGEKTEKPVKTDRVFKTAFNDLLQRIRSRAPQAPLGPETKLAEQLSVSRTTIRKILKELSTRGIIGAGPDGYVVLRRPRRAESFPSPETVSMAKRIEEKFMDWMLRGDRKPGDFINGLELARQFDVSPTSLREYLTRFSRFGLIEKRPNSSWLFKGFTAKFALELFQVRELFEITSARAFAEQPKSAVVWGFLDDIEKEHFDLLQNIETHFQDFSELDERFHRMINEVSDNRFFTDFYDVIALIFHYHYQWNKVDELQRNEVALVEHLKYIEALRSRDLTRVDAACRAHLSSARKTLLSSIG